MENNTNQPAPQDLRERAAMLFDELDGMVERLPKEANWFGNVDHIKQNINLLKKEFSRASEVSSQQEMAIKRLEKEIVQLKEMNDAAQVQIGIKEQRIEELKASLYSCAQFDIIQKQRITELESRIENRLYEAGVQVIEDNKIRISELEEYIKELGNQL